MFTAADQASQQQYATGGFFFINLLIAPSISSAEVLSPSEFCKIHPLVVAYMSEKIQVKSYVLHVHVVRKILYTDCWKHIYKKHLDYRDLNFNQGKKKH